MSEALSLFTGSGIVDKVFQSVGFKIKGQVEIDDYCTALLERHHPDIPRARDIKTVGRKQLTSWGIGHTIDLIFGGPPCQPFSTAGQRRGKADDRYLWPQMYRLIRMLHPRAVFFENVPGIIPMVLNDILADLESEGYEAIPFVIPACAIGATHKRDRLFIMAYSQSTGKSEQQTSVGHKIGWTSVGSGIGAGDRDNRRDTAERVFDAGRTTASGAANVDDTTNKRFSQRRPNEQLASASEALARMVTEPERPSSVVHADKVRWRQDRLQQPSLSYEASQSGVGQADTCGPRLEVGQSIADDPQQEQSATQRSSGIAVPKERDHGPTQPRLGRTTDGDTRWLDSPRWPVPPGKEQEAWEAPRTAVGIVNRTHRLKVIGNAMVPQVVYPFAQAIYETLQAEGVANERTSERE